MPPNSSFVAAPSLSPSRQATHQPLTSALIPTSASTSVELEPDALHYFPLRLLPRLRLSTLSVPVGTAYPYARPAGVAGRLTLVLFGVHDLRLHDNTALHAAVSRGGAVQPVLLLHTRQSLPAFTRRAAQALAAEVAARGGELLVRRSVAEVGELGDRLGADAIHFNRSVEPHNGDQNITQSLRAARGFWSGFVRSPDEVSAFFRPDRDTKKKQPAGSCDEFNDFCSRVPVSDPLPAPDRLQPPTSLHAIHIESGRDALAEPSGSTANAKQRASGEDVALQRVRDYVAGKSLAVVDGAAIDTRLGKLGPFLDAGCVSARRVWYEVCTGISPTTVRRFCAELELVLRDYHLLLSLHDARCTTSDRSIQVATSAL